jgi:hypothetical protein
MLTLRGADPSFFDRSAPEPYWLVYTAVGTRASDSLRVLHANYFDQVLNKGLNTYYLTT